MVTNSGKRRLNNRYEIKNQPPKEAVFLCLHVFKHLKTRNLILK
ncbi:MAG: hypothetical protein ACI81S_001737 [Sphingobacteriales bacterium]|jgi:hypothetical protein